MSDETRIAIYGVMTAVLALASGQGWVTAEESAAYATAGAATLGAATTLLAAVKTWRQRKAKKAANSGA
jgi:mannose/fructose/N-acetylgalactosamine-specific phosphotransferase system component IIC